MFLLNYLRLRSVLKLLCKGFIPKNSSTNMSVLSNKTTTKVAKGVVHTVPEDLRQILLADPKALVAWESLTPLARNEWICWSISVKKPETRNEHIHRLQTQLKEGKRRPCCFGGCPHRQTAGKIMKRRLVKKI